MAHSNKEQWEKDLSKALESFTDDWQEKVKSADLKRYNNVKKLLNNSNSLNWASKGGLKNVESGHLKKLNEQILTFDKRSENRKIKIDFDVIKDICDESLTISEVSQKLDLTINTTRRLLKEYSLYEEFKNKPKPSDWNKRFVVAIQGSRMPWSRGLSAKL